MEYPQFLKHNLYLSVKIVYIFTESISLKCKGERVWNSQ